MIITSKEKAKNLSNGFLIKFKMGSKGEKNGVLGRNNFIVSQFLQISNPTKFITNFNIIQNFYLDKFLMGPTLTKKKRKQKGGG